MVRVRVGESGITTTLLRLLPPDTTTSILLPILSAMLAFGMIPKDWKKVNVALIPKGQGAFRPIALIETIYKILERIIKQRFWAACEQAQGAVFSGDNFAYQRGKGCEQALDWVLAALDDSRRTKNPLAVLALDIGKFYDEVDFTAIIAAMQSYSFPQQIVNLVYDKLHDSPITINTPWGKAPTFKRKIGLEQGSILSTILCLLVLDPYQRASQALLTEAKVTYKLNEATQGNKNLLPGFPNSTATLHPRYCDDVTLLITGNHESIQTALTTVGRLNIGFCFGVEQKKLWGSHFGTHAKKITDKTFTLPNLDPNTRCWNPLTLQVKEEGFVLLGAHINKKGQLDQKASAASIIRNTNYLLHTHIRPRSTLPMIITTINTVIVPKTISYMAGHGVMSETQLRKVDSTILRYFRRTLGNHAIPRTTVFLSAENHGYGVTSPSQVLIKALARNVVTLLEDTDTLGGYHRACLKQGAGHICGLVKALARNGIQITLSEDVFTARVLARAHQDLHSTRFDGTIPATENTRLRHMRAFPSAAAGFSRADSYAAEALAKTAAGTPIFRILSGPVPRAAHDAINNQDCGQKPLKQYREKLREGRPAPSADELADSDVKLQRGAHASLCNSLKDLPEADWTALANLLHIDTPDGPEPVGPDTDTVCRKLAAYIATAILSAISDGTSTECSLNMTSRSAPGSFLETSGRCSDGRDRLVKELIYTGIPTLAIQQAVAFAESTISKATSPNNAHNERIGCTDRNDGHTKVYGAGANNSNKNYMGSVDNNERARDEVEDGKGETTESPVAPRGRVIECLRSTGDGSHTSDNNCTGAATVFWNEEGMRKHLDTSHCDDNIRKMHEKKFKGAGVRQSPNR